MALVAAAVLVPTLMVLYLYVTDIYEDEPLWVYAATMLWGALAGVVYGWPCATFRLGVPLADRMCAAILLAGVALPLVEGALMIAGPLLLLRRHASTTCSTALPLVLPRQSPSAAPTLLVQSADLLGAGLRPAGDPLPWVIQLVSLGVLQPVIAAGAIGAAAAAFWLRYRAPITDRHALGIVGRAVAALLAAALLVVAGLAKSMLTLIPATIVLAAVAAWR